MTFKELKKYIESCSEESLEELLKELKEGWGSIGNHRVEPQQH